MKDFGYVRAIGQEGTRLDIIAMMVKRPETIGYLKGVLRSRGMSTSVDLYLLAESDRVEWGYYDDPLSNLTDGVLLLDREEIWQVPSDRPGLECSVAWRWSVLPVWEKWAVKHAPEDVYKPRRATEALCAALNVAGSREEWRRARDDAWVAGNAAFDEGNPFAGEAAWASGWDTAWLASTHVSSVMFSFSTKATPKEILSRSWTAHALYCALTGRWKDTTNLLP